MSKGYWPMRGNWTNAMLLDLESRLEAAESDKAIAKGLGKTVTAIRLARKRYGIPSRRRLRYTGRGVAQLLGVGCSKTVARWVELGWLTARRGERVGRQGRVLYISRSAIERFLDDPRGWPAWRPERIQDEGLRLWTLELRSQALLTTGQVGERLGIGHSAVHSYISRGLLPAQRYGNWWVRESDLEGFVLPCNRSKRGRSRRCFSQSERLRIWRLREEGDTWQAIADALGRNIGSVSGCYKRLRTAQSVMALEVP